MPMTPFASDDVLARYISEYGIISWADHDQDGVADDGVLEDCKTYAMGLLVGRLSPRYTYAVLITAPMMEEVFAIIALRELTLRRGNPPPASLETRYQEIMARDGLLDDIVSGRMPLVDADGNPIRLKNSNIPQHANLQIDRRFSERRVRVVTGSSNMSPTKLRRDIDVHQEFDPR